VREAAERGNVLLRQIGRGRGIEFNFARFVVLGTDRLADAVDLLVQLGTVEVTLLTGASNTVTNAGRMPRANTGDFAVTTVGLALQQSGTPTLARSLVTFTLANTDDINVIVLREDAIDRDLTLEQYQFL